MCCVQLFILICCRLCKSYMTSGNIGILGHIYKLRRHCSSRKIIKPPYLLLTRVIQKNTKKPPKQKTKGLPILPNALRFHNNELSIYDHSRTSFINAGYVLHLPSLLQYLIRKPRHAPGGPNQICIMIMLLNYSKQ